MKLRPIQNEALEAILDSFRDGGTYHLLECCISFGKTIVASELMRTSSVRYGAKCLFMCHLKELVEQTVDKFNQVAPELSCGVFMGNKKEQHDIIVGTRQTIGKNLDLISDINLILIDEVHLYGPQYQKIVDHCLAQNPRLRVLGLTGTPFTASQGYIYGDGKLWPEPCFSAYVDQMIEMGYLSKYRYKVTSNMRELEDLKLSKGEFKDSDLESLLTEEQHLGSVQHALDDYCQDRKRIMIFCVTIAHAESLATYLGCEVVHSKLNKVIWRSRVDAFKSGKTRILVNISQLSVGFDCPEVDCLIIARPTNSPALHSQICGRSLRVHPSKNYALILDLVNNYGRHGLPSNPKVRMPKEEQPKKEKTEREANVCHECFEVVEGGLMVCPFCGTDLTDKKELIEINEKLKLKEIQINLAKNRIVKVWNKSHVTKKGNAGVLFCIKLDKKERPLFKFCGNGTKKLDRIRDKMNKLLKGQVVDLVSSPSGEWIV